MTLQKLLVLNASATVLTVLLLAELFPSDSPVRARAELERRSEAYGSAIAARLESAPNLDPASLRELAERDPDIANVLLLTDASAGAPRLPGTRPYLLEFSDRVASVRPVVVNGAPATLIVELSNRPLARARADADRRLVLGAAVSLLLGALFVFAIARITHAVDARAARRRAWWTPGEAEHARALGWLLARAEPANDVARPVRTSHR